VGWRRASAPRRCCRPCNWVPTSWCTVLLWGWTRYVHCASSRCSAAAVAGLHLAGHCGRNTEPGPHRSGCGPSLLTTEPTACGIELTHCAAPCAGPGSGCVWQIAGSSAHGNSRQMLADVNAVARHRSTPEPAGWTASARPKLSSRQPSAPPLVGFSHTVAWPKPVSTSSPFKNRQERRGRAAAGTGLGRP